jgi:hypothetical protein
MKESVAVAKQAAAKKGVSPTRSDNSIHRVRDEPERQIGSLRGVIGNITRNGGTPSVESIAAELSGVHSAQRAPALLALQQTHGNRYVQRVVAGIQAKLKVGQPGDKYEQEADHMASRIMQRISISQSPSVPRQEVEEEELLTMPIASIQRQAEEEEEELQAKSAETIQRAGTDSVSQIDSGIEDKINAAKGSGEPLPQDVRGQMEQGFGADFSGVRVHTDSRADGLNQSLQARAFTTGQDIFFKSSEYDPRSSSGQQLLAHELTHTIQQGASSRISLAVTGMVTEKTHLQNMTLAHRAPFNDRCQRVLNPPAPPAGEVIQQTIQKTPDFVHRDLSDTIQRWPPSGMVGNAFPVLWDNRSNPWRVGEYRVAISLHGMLSLSPFGMEVTGDNDGIFITGAQTLSLNFSSGEFRSFEGEVEAGPLSLEFDTEGEEASITVDVLGIVWSEEMQEIVERVGEVTSDFNMTFARRNGQIVLSNIGMDLGLQLGPDQVHALAELSIATEYPEEGPATTTAEGEVSIHVNICGIERDITVAEGEAQVGDIRTRHEQQLRQFALREAFNQTYNDRPGTERMSAAQARSFLWSGFNFWYRETYDRSHRRVVDHYTAEGYDNTDDIIHSTLTPLSIFGGYSVIVEPWARGIIDQVIRRRPEPPGREVVDTIWNSVILPGTRQS